MTYPKATQSVGKLGPISKEQCRPITPTSKSMPEVGGREMVVITAQCGASEELPGPVPAAE